MGGIKGFWKHLDSGCIYAIENTPFGEVLGATGPLDPNRLLNLDKYEYDSKIIVWIKEALAEHKLHRFNP